MDHVVQYYEAFDEWGRLDREPAEFIVNWHFMKQNLPKRGHIIDIGAGPGRYSMKLAENGYQVALTDLSPRLVEIAKEKAKEQGLLGQFSAFEVVDARELSRFADEQFDAALMMGPLYHLQQEADRVSAIQQLHRVTKSDGTVYVAFMPRIRHVIASLLAPRQWKPNDSAAQIETFMDTGLFNHTDQGRFTGAYYFNIEEIEPFMESGGFETIKMIGSSNAGSLLNQEQWGYWKERGFAELDSIMELLKKTAENQYLLGISPHIMYIGKKIA
jgi:ubiquinone/menaquinone biosynthesis C-methylase UbiE